MAQRVSTYTFLDVLSAVSRVIPKASEDDFAQAICNATLNTVWKRWDWRESLAKLPPFWLVPNYQDYGAPAISVPNNFMGLRKAYLVRADTIPPMRHELDIIKDLSLTHVRFLPHAIGYNPSAQAFRVFPRTPDNIGSPNYMIEGEYKIRPTKILASSMASTLLPFDDIYWEMWPQVAKWAAFDLTGDQRAGTISISNGQKVYTGQMAVAMQAIDSVAANEGLELNDPVITPSSPLVDSGTWRPSGIFGLGW